MRLLRIIVEKRKVLLCVCLLFLTLEGTSRIVFWFSIRNHLIRPLPEPFDSICRLQWVMERRRQNNLVVRHAFAQYHPLRGWGINPNVRNLEVWKGKTLNTNSVGLRGMTEYALEKPKDMIRIQVYGCSNTLGFEVNDNETYAHYLQEKLPQTEVMNFGVQGYGIGQALQYFQEEGKKYKPDVVILGFYDFLMWRDVMSFRDYAKPRFVLRDGQIVVKNTPVPMPAEVLGGEVYRSKFLDLLTSVSALAGLKLGRIDGERFDLAQALVARMSQETSSAGAKFVFVYLDTSFRTADLSSMEANRNWRYENVFRRVCKENGAYFYSVREDFYRARKNGAVYERLGHFLPSSQRTVADGICGFVTRSGLADGRGPEKDIRKEYGRDKK